MEERSLHEGRNRVWPCGRRRRRRGVWTDEGGWPEPWDIPAGDTEAVSEGGAPIGAPIGPDDADVPPGSADLQIGLCKAAPAPLPGSRTVAAEGPAPACREDINGDGVIKAL